MIYKCKMCGGSLNAIEGDAIATCEYCGSKQTLPKTNNETLANLFNRANNLRLKCEFDKATQIYEKIIQEDDSEAEAHWGLVLCKYGIEYVNDPQTQKKIPTCHRASYDSVGADLDYQAAIDYSDSIQQSIYEQEARQIDRIQRDILSIVKNEKPFDVFICYKETDENGNRTKDSVIANDIYYQLIQEGFKVFYAAITLEDKLGQDYEPYIFAALNSAKVMLVVGTKPEYFNAVWVKNEWFRFLSLIKNDRTKLLIPCYKDMDAYDLPEEFSHLQAQDMSKIGFINDVVRGIKKILSANAIVDNKEAIEKTVNSNTNIKHLLRRIDLFLEDGLFNEANEYCEKVLDMNPECGDAYLRKLMIDLRVKKKEDIVNNIEPIEDYPNYQKVLRFGDEELVNTIKQYNNEIIDKEIQKRIDKKSAYNAYIEKRKAYKITSDIDDTVLFGSYIQSKEEEPIEWIVVKKDNNKALLLSKYVLEARRFNEESRQFNIISNDFQTSEIHEWLNNDFFNKAFIDEEKAQIKEITLLTIDQAKELDEKNRIGKPTEYAISNGCYASDKKVCCWWLSSPGIRSNIGTVVFYDGHIRNYGYGVSFPAGFRPALWVNIES